MKRYCKGLAFDRRAVEAGYADWLAAESGRKNGWRVSEQYGSADALIDEIVSEVESGTLSFEPIRRYERDEGGKHRTIGIVSVKQQVVEHAIVVALTPMLDARIGRWQVASVEGRGAFVGARKVQSLMRSCRYGVHADVRQCYHSVDLGAVMRMLRRYVASPSLLYVVSVVLATYGEGLEIGSYLSLRLSQLVLSFGYYHVESLGKRRRGRWRPWARQVWYADDVYLFGDSKSDLRRAVRSLDAYLRREFGLELKRWKVVRCDRETVDFAGIRCTPGGRTVRGRIFVRARRAFRRLAREPTVRRARRAIAFYGWLRNTDSRRVMARNDVPRLVAVARALVAEEDRRMACPTR